MNSRLGITVRRGERSLAIPKHEDAWFEISPTTYIELKRPICRRLPAPCINTQVVTRAEDQGDGTTRVEVLYLSSVVSTYLLFTSARRVLDIDEKSATFPADSRLDIQRPQYHTRPQFRVTLVFRFE
ncbi:hypothetical protein EVAR_24920_1 [Eumeta japonica]|uniref:Uncharacterized protein n=1 Tax=Eumeta variegata TaxID=151549 RepID=A0A4C1V6H8_EUMVA|nr:hypothetical protein EVAR_24920_1 [Eumeta japonica]